MHFRHGLREWRSRLAKIATEKQGIVRVIAVILHVLSLASPTEWADMTFGTEDRPAYSLTDTYVFVILLLSVWIYLIPSVWLASLSSYFSASTIILLMNIVLLQGLFGKLLAPERSLLLFLCNVAQVTLMFGTWYRLGGYSQTEALLKSTLTFATISYAEEMPRVAMAQIATDFLLLAIFLSYLVSQFGPKNGTKGKPS
jgi:hypothetical protein